MTQSLTEWLQQSRLTVVAGDIQTAGIPGVTAYTDTHDVFDFTK